LEIDRTDPKLASVVMIVKVSNNVEKPRGLHIVRDIIRRGTCRIHINSAIVRLLISTLELTFYSDHPIARCRRNEIASYSANVLRCGISRRHAWRHIVNRGGLKVDLCLEGALNIDLLNRRPPWRELGCVGFNTRRP
jgi:hypothetical protein